METPTVGPTHLPQAAGGRKVLRLWFLIHFLGIGPVFPGHLGLSRWSAASLDTRLHRLWAMLWVWV